MNRKLGLTALVVVLVVGAAWLFRPVPAPAPKVVEAPKPAPAKVDPPKPVAKTTQIAAPVLAPVAAKASTAPAPAKTSDPQAELNTAFADIINLLQSGDILTAMHRYLPPDFLAKMPPQQLAMMEQQLPAEMARPEAQQGIQMMITVLQSMQTQTPTMNETGDKATYQVTDPEGRAPNPEPFSMKKIDGKWYVDPEAMGGM
jgi:hypothetical protein